MLAKVFQDHSHKLDWPVYVQPKLDGVRALYYDGSFQSRDEKSWANPVLQHLADHLVDMPGNWILDGELYLHGASLQIINGAISINRLAPCDKTLKIQYHVFDGVPVNQLDRPFGDRWQELTFDLTTSDLIKRVETHLVTNPRDADRLYGHFREIGYEGMMYRQDHRYGIEEDCTNKENRWDVLLKRKGFVDDEFDIVGIEEGEGKYKEALGAIVCITEDGKYFNVGGGISDIMRARWYTEPPIGKTATIRYRRLSDEGKPLEPRFIALREEGV